MGFGILFIGYLFTYLLSLAGAYGCFPEFIGCLIMMYALTKLIEYEPKFKYAFFVLIPLAVCVGYSAAIELVKIIGVSLPSFLVSGILKTVAAYAKLALDLFFNGLLLLAIAKIAEDTENKKTSRAAFRNMIIYAIYFVLALVNSFLPGESTANRYVFIIAFAFSLVLMLLNSIVIFSCYMKICDEADYEMQRKEAKIGFINDLRKEFDRREEKAHREYREYRSEKQKKQVDKLNNSSKRKKK